MIVPDFSIGKRGWPTDGNVWLRRLPAATLEIYTYRSSCRAMCRYIYPSDWCFQYSQGIFQCWGLDHCLSILMFQLETPISGYGRVNSGYIGFTRQPRHVPIQYGGIRTIWLCQIDARIWGCLPKEFGARFLSILHLLIFYFHIILSHYRWFRCQNQILQVEGITEPVQYHPNPTWRNQNYVVLRIIPPFSILFTFYTPLELDGIGGEKVRDRRWSLFFIPSVVRGKNRGVS